MGQRVRKGDHLIRMKGISGELFSDAEDDGVFDGVCQLDALKPEPANAGFEMLEPDVGRREDIRTV